LYEMWYSGVSAEGMTAAVGLATSIDGIAWTKYPGNPVFTGAGNQAVIMVGDDLKMYYRLSSGIGYAANAAGYRPEGPGGYVLGAEIGVPFTRNSPDVASGTCQVSQWENASLISLDAFDDTNPISSFVHTALGYLLLEYNDEGVFGCADLVTEKNITMDADFVILFDTAHDGWNFSYGVPTDDLEWDAVPKIISLWNGGVSVTKSTFLPYSSHASLSQVIIAARIAHSPNIACVDLEGCHVAAGLTSDANLMWTFLVPLKVLTTHLNASNPNTIGFAYLSKTAGSFPDNTGKGFSYPRSVKGETIEPLANLTFLSQTTTTTTLVLTSVAISPVTSTTTMSVTTTETIQASPAPSVLWTLVVLVVVGTTTVFLFQHRTRKK
jgi:hypothetical protein